MSKDFILVYFVYYIIHMYAVTVKWNHSSDWPNQNWFLLSFCLLLSTSFSHSPLCLCIKCYLSLFNSDNHYDGCCSLCSLLCNCIFPFVISLSHFFMVDIRFQVSNFWMLISHCKWFVSVFFKFLFVFPLLLWDIKFILIHKCDWILYIHYLHNFNCFLGFLLY